ncbi:MAG: BMP family ABC transporter substrate-binding protein, partial [Clostridiales bacterium]|nr:BMP family ABC transporter substrate-binding protein [Clostridiales bacterium]
MSKKFFAVLLSVALFAALFTGCTPKTITPAKSENTQTPTAQTKGIPKDKIKVGFVYVGSATDGGYSQAHDKGRQEVEQKLGVKTQYVENVPENADCEKAIRDLIDQGCNVIYANSFNYGDYVLNVAKDYPNVYFGHATGLKTAKNVSIYMGRIEEPRYLSGIAAGLRTKSNKIGFVAAMPIAEVVRGINAFTLGVRSVNSKATVEVVWTNTWYDPSQEKAAAVELINRGCDVIAQHCDSTGPEIAAQEKGVYAVGYN